MSNVIVKENAREAVQRLVYSRRFVKENITKNQALSVRKNLKLQENANIINNNRDC